MPAVHFLPEARKISRSRARGCIFSRAPIVQVVAFRLVVGAVLIVPPATLSSSSAAAFQDIAVVEEEVRIRAACEQSASRSGSRGESRDRKPSPARWAMAFRPRLSPCSISSRYEIAGTGGPFLAASRR